MKVLPIYVELDYNTGSALGPLTLLTCQMLPGTTDGGVEAIPPRAPAERYVATTWDGFSGGSCVEWLDNFAKQPPKHVGFSERSLEPDRVHKTGLTYPILMDLSAVERFVGTCTTSKIRWSLSVISPMTYAGTLFTYRMLSGTMDGHGTVSF